MNEGSESPGLAADTGADGEAEGNDTEPDHGERQAGARDETHGARPHGAAARPSAARGTVARARTKDRADDPRTGVRKPPKPPAPKVAADAAASAAEPAAAHAGGAEEAFAHGAAHQSHAPAEGVELAAGGESASLRLDESNPLTGPLLPARLAENIERIEVLGQRLVRALAQRTPTSPQVEAPGPDLYASAMQAWFKLASEQPARIIGNQVRFWGDTLRHVAQAQHAFAKGFSAPPDDGPEDRRFTNPLWRTNPFYSFVRRQYLINAEALRKAIADLEIEAAVDRRRIDWFTRQIIDMLSPTNFLATNPDALEKAIQTEGESLVKGLENLVADVEAGGGQLVVSLADRNAFRVGENIGTTPGDVVYRTPLFELIQYRPTTEQVHKVPLVMFPPWINKFYILDLKPENSLLRWLVGQGHTLFVVSWKNPDEHYADVGLEDYVAAYLEVIGKVLELTGEPRLNAIGYCIAGTTLAMTLSVMKQRGDDRVASASFFTALTDFSDQGEFTTFLQDDFVSGIEEEVARRGYLSAKLMQRTFSFLRANDLVWGPAIRSYMLGESPPAFDLLFWNGDGTNLPARMVTEYLRGLCQRNALATTGYPVLDVVAHLRDVTVPLCAIACEGDHIAPWKHSWAGIAQMESPDRTFILSESGHIAGIINPPGKVKYGHYISDAGFGGTPDDWRKKAEHHQGSWWPRWGAWLAEKAGDKVAARQPQDSLGAAPGSYVHETV